MLPPPTDGAVGTPDADTLATPLTRGTAVGVGRGHSDQCLRFEALDWARCDPTWLLDGHVTRTRL